MYVDRENHKNMVLLVHEEIPSREVFRIALQEWGHNVYVAKDGNEALRIFRLKHPAVVISDLFIPRMEGINLLQALKRISPTTPVILFSDCGSAEDAVALMRLGAADFFAKPIHYARLKRVLEKLLSVGERREQSDGPSTSRRSFHFQFW